MGMFFNSWKDEDAEYYYGCTSEVGSSNYNRGYDDGYYSGKKSVTDSYDKGYNEGYNKGFKAGLNLYFQKKEPLKKDALEILMDELEANELSRKINTIDFTKLCCELAFDEPESVVFDECAPECELDEVIDIEPPIDSPL